MFKFFVCLEFNATFNSFGHITAVSAPTHVFLAFLHQYLHNILSKPLTTFSHRSEVRGDGKIARKNVAATGYRTRDLQITSQIRYQLSYPAGLFKFYYISCFIQGHFVYNSKANSLHVWCKALTKMKWLNLMLFFSKVDEPLDECFNRWSRDWEWFKGGFWRYGSFW